MEVAAVEVAEVVAADQEVEAVRAGWWNATQLIVRAWAPKT